jgi:hypothetical protein
MIDKADRNSQVFPDRIFSGATLYLGQRTKRAERTVGECAKRSALSYLRT